MLTRREREEIDDVFYALIEGELDCVDTALAHIKVYIAPNASWDEIAVQIRSLRRRLKALIECEQLPGTHSRLLH